MSDSISGVIIPLVIPVDAPSSLGSCVKALASHLENSDFGNACLQLQQSFCYLTWHFADFSSRHLTHLGAEAAPCSPFGHARAAEHLSTLQQNLDGLAEVASRHSEAGDIFRVFYVGGLRARQSSPRRHTRLLGLGGQTIRGYRNLLDWCQLEIGEEDLAGEMRCQRELRRYLPILREWLDSSSGHFRQIKGFDWYQQALPATDLGEPIGGASAVATPKLNPEVLSELTPVESAPPTPGLASLPSAVLFHGHQVLFERELEAGRSHEAATALGRLSGLIVSYMFAVSAAALRLIGQLDSALEKRIDTPLTLRQKQTSLSFLLKSLAQHQSAHPLIEKVARAMAAPTGGKLHPWYSGSWGGGHTFAEFCQSSEAPDNWEERFLPGVRLFFQQFAAWFAEAEHYFQLDAGRGTLGMTIQLGDDHLEVDRKALLLEATALKLSAGEFQHLLSPRQAEIEVVETTEPQPEVVEPTPVEATDAAPEEFEFRNAEEHGWLGPEVLLQLWDRGRQSNWLTLGFLIQYTVGLELEWMRLNDQERPDWPTSALECLQLLAARLSDDSDLQPWLTVLRGGPVGVWLFSQEFEQQLHQPELSSLAEARISQWIQGLQDFFQQSEQMFEEPSSTQLLEGVVIYQDQYLELVDHPINLADRLNSFWPDSQPLQVADVVAKAEPGQDDEEEVPAEASFNLELLPAEAREYFGELWQPGELNPEGLVCLLEFLIQYFSGLLTAAAIQEADLEASHLNAWRVDSNLLERQEMLQQVLKETSDQGETLPLLRAIFLNSTLSDLWATCAQDLVDDLYHLREGDESSTPRLRLLAQHWLSASQDLLGQIENLCEPIDAAGRLEIVGQRDELFMELVDPEFSIWLIAPGEPDWRDTVLYRNLHRETAPAEVLLGSEEGDTLLGGGVVDSGDDFFGETPEVQMESLFREPAPAPDPPAPSSPRPKLVATEPEATAPAPSVSKELRLNEMMEQLLQQPEETAAVEAASAEPTPAEAPPEGAGEATSEKRVPARLDAPQKTEKMPEYIVVDPPALAYTIHYVGKEGPHHSGNIEIRNEGGGVLKGTVKSNHPCLRVKPSMFRSNEAEIAYWIDDADRPSNLAKIGLTFHFSGQKVELPIEKLLPDTKFKQLAKKVLGLVKNLGPKK